MKKNRKSKLAFILILLCCLSLPTLARPPKVIKATPDNGEKNVAPSTKEIRIQFDQAMNTGGYSFCGGGANYPKTIGKPKWIDKKTVVLTVKLKPNHKYMLSINSRSYKNFKSINGESAIVYPITFETGAAGSSSKRKLSSKFIISKLHEAIYAEETEGDLDKAIDLYQQVITQASKIERIAAKASYKLGMCYLKKDDKASAAKYFQAVVEKYPSQRAYINKAKEQLEKIGVTSTKMMTQEMHNAIDSDGLIHFKSPNKTTNNDFSAITTRRFMNSDFVKLTKMYDANNTAIPFEVTHQGSRYHYVINFTKPIMPGESFTYYFEGTIQGLVKPVDGKEGVFRYFMIHNPGANQPVLRIETYLLPDGAELISKHPDLQQSEKDGRIELHVEKVIPAGGNIKTEFQYRLQQGKTTNREIILKDSFEEGTDTPIGWKKGKDVDGVEYIWDKNNGSDGMASLCLKKTANRYFPIAQWSKEIKYETDAKKLSAAVKVRAKNANKAILDALFLDVNGKWIKHEWISYIGENKEKNTPPANHNWKKYSGIVDIPEGTKTIVIGLQIYGPGTIWFDELEVAYLTAEKKTNILQAGDSQIESNLQKKIDSAKSEDTITIPKGLYTEPIIIDKSLTLKGRSRTECVFEVTADKPAVFINTKGKGKVTIEDITIKWQLATSEKNNNSCALLVKDSKAKIINCKFLASGNYKRSPIALNVSGFSNTIVDSSQFEGFDYVVCYHETTKGKFLNNIIKNCKSQGITLYRDASVDIIGNIIAGSKKHAVKSTGGALRMENNLLINNANRGVYLGNKSATGTIKNNAIIANETGIGGFGNSSVKIENNVISDSTYAGIGFKDSCRLQFNNNIFTNNERGWIMFEYGNRNGNGCQMNTFWKNKTDVENFRKTGNSILENPNFVDAANGDFSLKPGPALDNKQGLTNPQIIKQLWQKYKNPEDEKETKNQQTRLKDEKQAEDLTAQGWKLWRERKLAEAEEKFKQAIVKNPEAENAYQGLGWAQLNQGKKLNAKDSFEKCVKLNPKNSAALNGLGWIADGQGDIDGAIKWWEKAVKASNGNATASLSGLTKVYMEKGDYENGIKYYKIWLKAEPNNEDVKEGLKKAIKLNAKK
ncbi:MAG: right-handed parallel beta-helix repeat-containing protein [Planctomycetes bacterium]|nr:right-handed parallel beta-helix repeat-containing protein [Planctomycetota bacterium]